MPSLLAPQIVAFVSLKILGMSALVLRGAICQNGFVSGVPLQLSLTKSFTRGWGAGAVFQSIWSSSMLHPGPSALEQLLMQQKQKQQRGHGTMNPPH